MRYGWGTRIGFGLFTLACLFCVTATAQQTEPHNVKPTGGYVSDAETAILIAVAIWDPIYGKEKIASEKPYQASLKDGIWHVSGSLPEGWFGGTAIADIAKDDGCILRISHGK